MKKKPRVMRGFDLSTLCVEWLFAALMCVKI